MANVRIRDRCGKTIAATTAQRFGFSAWRYSLYKGIPVSKATVSDWDLCASCGEKLERFLKGEAAEAVKENVDGDLD